MMNRELLARVLSEKKAARSRNEDIEARRMDEVCAASPEIARLIEERRQAFFAGLRSALNGVAPLGIEEETEKRNLRIAQLLEEAGYGADYLSPIFDCPLCEDTGYRGESKKTLCSCVETRYQQLLFGETFQDEQQTFENYDERVIPGEALPGHSVTQRAYTRTLRNDCERYADSLPDGAVLNLLLHGGSGLGKSYLLRSIGVRATQKGVQTLCLSANALLNRIRAQYFARQGETADDSHYEVPLLLIDDLGTEPLWEGITVEQLFSLIEHRLNHHLHTVISTNLSLTELKARYTERLMSRLLDGRQCRVLTFIGKDMRHR